MTTNTEPREHETAPEMTVRDRLARLITEILAPWVIVLLLPLAVAWQATYSIGPTLLWGLIVALTSSILPMAVIVWGARTQRWEGHHVRNRHGRLIPFLALIGFTAIGLGILVAADAPWPVIALDIAQVTALLVTGAITVGWKVSMHTAVGGGAVVVLAVTYSPWLWPLMLLVAAIGWSRVHIRDHTAAQTAGGAIIGALVIGGLYVLVL